MSMPFRGKTFTFTQPDGTKIDLRGWGDQHYAVFETMDGFTVVQNPATGFYEVAQVSDDGSRLEAAPVPQGSLDGTRASIPRGVRIAPNEAHARGMEGVQRFGGRRCDQRREQRKAMTNAMMAFGGPLFAPPQRQTVGDYVGLCLLIDFSDEVGTIPRDEVERFCNQSGYSGFGNSGSVSDYFRDNSLNRCRYTNIVTNYYRAAKPKTYYTDRNIQQGVRARQLILEALQHWKSQGFDFSGLTADSEGYVFAMNVYYAGEVVNNWSEGLWPHAWHLASPVTLAPGKRAFDYQFTDMSHQLTLGTFCHENGHMLCDYPDLYDYGNESSGVGAYCLMCAGGNINEKNPTQISGYLKRLSGWSGTVSTVQHGERLELFANKNDCAIFSKSPGEYYLFENRHKSGRDVSLTDEGLAVWHIDENGNNSNEQMTAASHYELSLKQADGLHHLEKRAGQFGDAQDLYGRVVKRFAADTLPGSKWWDGSASNLEIYEISDPGPSVRFRTRLFADGGGGGEEEPVTILQESTPARSIPDNSSIGVTDTLWVDRDGTITTFEVSVDITHPFRGDLQVSLVTPTGATIRLHQRRQGGSADDLRQTYTEANLPGLSVVRGRSVKGSWQLMVQDLAAADVGRLNRWGLKALVAATASGPVTLDEAAGVLIPDNHSAGIVRGLTTSASGKVGSVEVSVDITHTYIGDLRVSLRSPAGTEIVLHDLTGGGADNLIKTYTAAVQPQLGLLVGQPIAGTWRLTVSDRAGQDIGKLNTWRVVIQSQ